MVTIHGEDVVIEQLELDILLRLRRQQCGILYIIEAQFVKAFLALPFDTGLCLVRRQGIR